jgi:ubiquinone biosynthesis protein
VNIRLPRTVRSIQRVQTIARVLTHHGFGHLVDKLHLGRYVPLKRWRVATVDGADASIGRRLAEVMQELGPTFVKLGQMLSTRPDVVPAEIVAELSHLQDQVPPFDTTLARQIIERDLGAPIDKCFAQFDAEPFASGSIAQVYRAVVREYPGEEAPAARKNEEGKTPPVLKPVVVKVKRPDIEEVVRLDMIILRWIADLAERVLPELTTYQPRTIVDEFERSILREMDFINEAATITRFSEAFGDDPYFRLPLVHWHCTGPTVLTLDRLEGISAKILLAQGAPDIDKRALADRLARAFMRQFFEMGIFHADPHPGNLLITPPATIGLIDFGLTGQIDDEMLGHLVIALTGALNHEADVIVEVLDDMNALGDTTDKRQLRREFMELIDKYYGLPLHRFDLQTLFYEITGLIQRNQVTLPREFVLLGKSLVGVGGICLQLDPELDLLNLLRPRIMDLFAKRLSPRRLAKATSIGAWHLFNMVKAAPGQMREVFRRLSRGQWQVHIRHENLDDLAHELDRASNRLGISILVAAIIVGSSLIIGNESRLPLVNVPLGLIGGVGYLVAGVLGLWLIISMLRSGRLS